MTAAEFQNKYKDFFATLQRETDKGKRWDELAGNRGLYNQFIVELLKCTQRLSDTKIECAQLEEEPISFMGYHKTFDGVVYMEALKLSIENYDLKKGLFVTYFKRIYNNEHIDASKPAELTLTMLKLIKAIQKKQEAKGRITARDIIRRYGDEFEKQGICKIYKADPGNGTRQLAQVALNVIKYMDYSKPISIDDPDVPGIPDSISGKEFENIEEQESRRCIVEGYKGNPLKYECYRALFTRDAMKWLKLDEKGKPYSGSKAGNEDIYNYLEDTLGFLWKEICYKVYIAKIIEEKPEKLDDLYGQYCNKLSTYDVTSRGKHKKVLCIKSDEIFKEAVHVQSKILDDCSKEYPDSDWRKYLLDAEKFKKAGRN